MININSFNPNQIKIDKKSYKNIDIYYIVYITIKNISNVKIISINPSYLIINEENGYIEESNGNKYPALVSNDEVLKEWTKLCGKIKDSISNTSG